MRKDLYLDMDLVLEPRYTKEFVVKQKDGINLFISLKNENKPVSTEGQIARLYVRKQDGSVVVQGGGELGDNTISTFGNTVLIKLKNSATNTVGLCYAELELEDDEGVMTTQSFIFEVIDRLSNVDNIISAVDDIYILSELEKFIVQAKKDLNELRESISILQTNINGAISDFNKKVEEFNKSVDTRLNDAKVEIDRVKENTMSEVRASQQETISEIQSIKEDALLSLQETISAVNTVVEDANKVKDELDITQQEGQELNNTLNELIANCEVLIEQLSIENDEAISNIEELNPLNDEADINIEELKALIQEAKDIAIPTLKQYIETFIPAENLKELNERLEVVYNGLNELDVRFNNYYTKAEIDEKINAIKIPSIDHLASIKYVNNVIIETQNESFGEETILQFNNIVEKLS